MSTKPQFPSFKGLKQYTPEYGWEQVNAILQSQTQTAAVPAPASHQTSPQAQQQAAPDNVPTLTETFNDRSGHASPMFDPLINELFEQLRVPPNDDLTQTWRTIASKVNLLTERMALQRELQERVQKLDQELLNLRSIILSHLSKVQHAADQQLTAARLRAEVSALAQAKLSEKLKN